MLSTEVICLMKLKYSYQMNYGYHQIVGPGQSGLRWIDFGMLNLAPGEMWEDTTGEREFVLMLQKGSGKADVSTLGGPGISYFKLGPRKNVFSEQAWMLYLPPRVSFTVAAGTEGLVGAAVFGAASHEGKPFLVEPEMIQPQRVGRENWSREVSLATIPECGAKRLIIGETFNPPGNWSSYPPHKHDDQSSSGEVALEEVYYYRLMPENGFALQRIYDPPERQDRIDEVILVEDGDTVVLPRGYHPVVAAGGYRLYYLWIMAGEEPVHGAWSDDPAHKWILSK